MTWKRAQPSFEFEARVVERLRSSGWGAYLFGQGLLPEDCRERLKDFRDDAGREALIRWMPDVIAFRDFDRRPFVALIDAKAKTSYPNYSIQLQSLEACEIYADRFFTPTFYVFDGESEWGVITPQTVRRHGVPGWASKHGSGSGTPFLLIGKHHALPFTEIFPPTEEGSTNG